MKIGLIQMPVSADKAQNLSYAVQEIEACAKQDAALVVLPEMFMCPYTNEAFPLYAEPVGGKTWQVLSDAARDNGIVVVGGSMPEREDAKVYNTSFVFDIDGKEIAKHRKMHLFDIDVEGGQRFKESDVFTAGSSVTMFEVHGIKIGLCICFDMRFPELSRLMTLSGAQMIIVPGAFNMTTGPAHWELMFRQRAVDNQLYTIGVAPARDESGPYVSYGNSMIASPWGDIVYRAEEKPETLVVDIDLGLNNKIRSQLPLLSARRTDIYNVDRR